MDEAKNRANDPYLEALLIIAKHYQQNFSREHFFAHLPPREGNVTYPQLIQAASLLNLSAKVYKATIAKLYNVTLPAILILENDEVCVLNKIDKDKATITRTHQPDHPEEISLKKLKEQYKGYCFIILPTFHIERPKIKKDTKINWLWRVVIKQMPTYSEIILASFLINLFTLASPLFIMNVYDKVIPNQAFETLWTLTFAILIVIIFDFILRQLRTYFIDASSRNVDLWFSATLYEQLLDIKMAERPPSIGQLINGMQAFDSVKEFLSSSSIIAVVDFPFLILFWVIIYFLGGWLVLVPMTIVPIVLLISYLNQLGLTNVIKQMVQLNSKKQAMLVETLENVSAVKLNLSEGVMQSRWENLTSETSKLNLKIRNFTNFNINLSIFSQYLSSVAIIVAGVYRVTMGEMTVGELIAVSILTGRSLATVTGLATILGRYKQAKASYQLINSILELPVERPEEKQFLPIYQFQNEIALLNVSFSYPQQKQLQLENVNFSIKPLERIGIVGLNGSGKSTILKLILKLYEPTTGNILINSIDYQQIDPADLRRLIGYLPQEVALFQGTILDNLKLGVIGVDDQNVMQAAELSGLKKMLSEHPDGLQRQVGERGLALSGGERQIIGLTRALLHNPPILILDEPTNSMDDLATAHFQHIMKQLSPLKTIIIVTHKLSLLELTERIIVIAKGKIVADGKREEILNKMKRNK